MKRSVGAETEGEGSPRSRTDPIIREMAKDFIFGLEGKSDIQGDFFNWPPPEFAKCWLVSN